MKEAVESTVVDAAGASTRITPHVEASPSNAPPHLERLVDRAAALLRARGVMVVDFAWWDAGEDTNYIGRLEWCEDMAPRVVVYDARSGDFVCRSLVGDCYAIDGSMWVLETADDMLDRYEWEERARHKLAGSIPEINQSLQALRDRMAKDHASDETDALLRSIEGQPK